MDDSRNSPPSPPPSTPKGEDAMRKFFDASNAARQHIADSAMATQLDELGDYLLSRSEAMQAVSTMSEPVRNDAIAIARDILRKLKISFGACTLLDGLGLKNAEDGVLFGGIKDVVQMVEHMVAWACGIDASILSDPSVQAAIGAIGKLGYLAKRESLRLAKQANLALLANRLVTQMAALDAQHANAMHDKVGDLLDLIERGMNRVVNRVTTVSVSGGSISHVQETQGHFMSTPPTAGLARQQGASSGQNRDAVGKRSMEALMAEEAAHAAEAARIMAQNAARSKRNEKTTQAMPARPTLAAARQALQQVRAQRRVQQQTTIHGPVAPNAAAANNLRIQMGLHVHEEEILHEQDVLKQQQILAQRQTIQRVAAQRQNAQRPTVQTPATGTVAHHGHGHHHLETHTVDASHAMETHGVENHIVVPHALETHTTEPAHKPLDVAAIDPHLLKGLDLKGFDMSGVTGAPVTTSNAEMRQQLAAAAQDPNHAPLPPVPPINPNKGLMR